MAIYGVKFGESGKEYYFDGQNLKLNKNRSEERRVGKECRL